jgi:KDO2-lipid IV(A) lauroyltransferase
VTSPTPRFGRKLAWRLEAIAFDLATAVLRLFPVDGVSAFGASVFRALGPLTPSHRVADANIRLAFPEMDAAGRKALLRAQWANLGRTFFEFPLADRLTLASGRIEVVNPERLAEIARSGKPVVFISGHLSNWELMAAAIVQSGIACQITYRAANNPYVDASFKRSRARYGVKLFAPKGGEGAREMLESMAKGESSALMNDQKFNGGVRAPFFGHPADTAPGPTRLALRFGTVLQPMSMQRTRGARFRLVVHPPIELERTGDRTRDIEAGVRQVNAFVEARVRERPEEWFWVHRRWPREVYAELEAAS